MSTRWKILVCGSVVLAAAALGLAVALWLGLDTEIAQGDAVLVPPDGEIVPPGETLSVDLSQVMLAYDDPMRGMAGEITARQVFQDALWWQINDPETPLEQRVEAFLVVGMMHEGRSAEITQRQADNLMTAVQQVWGPVVVAAVQEEFPKLKGVRVP